MASERDWQDAYYDGDDLGAADEHLFPIDDEDEDWYSDLVPTVTIVDDETWEWLLAYLDEEEDDEHSL